MLTDDAEANRLVEQEFVRWAESVALPEKLRTMRMARASDGEAFAMLVANPQVDSPVKLDLRLVEADQVATPDLARQKTRPNATDGIVFDADGNPVEYHLLKSHPGDDRGPLSLDYDRVPAGAMIHYFRADRPGQNRGIPEIMPALPLFAQLRRYTLAVLAAAETAADFAAVEEFEFVRASQKAIVNGREFVGPVNVVRKSVLGEISFVDLGADGQTTASVAAAARAQEEEQVAMDETNDNHTETTEGAERTSTADAQAPGVQGTYTGSTAAQIRAEALAESNRIAEIRRFCAGRFPEIEAHGIREGWDRDRCELEALRTTRPKAPADHFCSKRLDAMSNVAWVGTAHSPIYAPACRDQRGLVCEDAPTIGGATRQDAKAQRNERS